MTNPRPELLAALAQEMTAAANAVSGDWDAFSVVAEITALGVRVTGFRYLSDAAGLPMLMGDDIITTIADLRAASPGPNGELFDLYIARLQRADGRVEDQAFAALNGAGYRITAVNVTQIAELVRPGLPFLPARPAEAPATSLAPTAPAADDQAPAADDHDTEGDDKAAEHHEPNDSHELAAPATTTTGDADLAPLTADVLNWPEMAGKDWTSYAAAVSFRDDHLETIGFRYRDDAAIPTLVGGEFHRHLNELRAARPDDTGQPAGAALLRLPDRSGPVQVRLVYGDSAKQITWTGVEPTLAARMRPDASTVATGDQLPEHEDGDLLDAAGLLERIKADVAASLRARDGWSSFALAVDIENQRAVAFLYDQDGTPTRFVPLLSPVDDIRELREQTARPDGSQWSGVVLRSWTAPGTVSPDRIDVTFYGREGIDAFIGRSPDEAALNLGGVAEPTGPSPAVPWPPQGGFLDSGALSAAVTRSVLSSPDLASNDWDSVAVVIHFSGSAPSASALRFTADGSAAAASIPRLGPVGKFRRATALSDQQLWTACILRGRRGDEPLAAEFLTGTQAEELATTTATIDQFADLLRP